MEEFAKAARAQAGDSAPKDEFDPTEIAEVEVRVAAIEDQWRRKWLDEPIPALSGRTPREPEEEEEVAVALARCILADESSGRDVELPSKFDINEWEVMRSFSLSLERDDQSVEFLDAINGRGAFPAAVFVPQDVPDIAIWRHGISM